MSHFNFNLGDLNDGDSFGRAAAANQTNFAPEGLKIPLRTSAATALEPQMGLTTFSASNIAQALQKPLGVNADLFNQDTSNLLLGILNREGGVQTLLGGRAKFGQEDIIKAALSGATGGALGGVLNAAVGSATSGSSSPVTGESRPAESPDGPINIVTVQGIITVNTQIASQLDALLTAAKADGITFGGGGYRDPAAQIAVRKSNCGTSHYDIYEKPSSQCSPPTAIPGTSMHERGLAIDFTVGGKTLSKGGAGFQWLSVHAAEYGLKNFPKEAWHWSTNGK